MTFEAEEMAGLAKYYWAVSLICLLLCFWPSISHAQDTPCADLKEQISALKQEIARLRDANAMLVENLVNCGREMEDLRDEIEALKKKQNEKQN